MRSWTERVTTISDRFEHSGPSSNYAIIARICIYILRGWGRFEPVVVSVERTRGVGSSIGGTKARDTKHRKNLWGRRETMHHLTGIVPLVAGVVPRITRIARDTATRASFSRPGFTRGRITRGQNAINSSFFVSSRFSLRDYRGFYCNGDAESLAALAIKTFSLFVEFDPLGNRNRPC